MSALLAIIILILIMFIMGMCFYAQWQMMKVMRKMPGVYSAVTLVASTDSKAEQSK